MKIKAIISKILIVIAISQCTTTLFAQKNYYQFGLGVWVFEPTITQVYAMSYERMIKEKFAFGVSYSYLLEEWTGNGELLGENIPLHHFLYGRKFTHPDLLLNNVEDAGLVNLQGHLFKSEESFTGVYVSYMPFSRERLSVDLAVGLGLVFYNMRWLNSTIYCTINIDSADIYGVAQLNTISSQR